MHLCEVSSKVKTSFLVKEVYEYLNSLKISSKVNSEIECANLTIFKKNMKKVKKMEALGRTILKKTLKELDKSINNEI